MVVITGDIDSVHLNHADLTSKDGTPVRRQYNMLYRNLPVKTGVCRKSLDTGKGNYNDYYIEAIVNDAMETIGRRQAQMMSQLTERKHTKIHVTRIDCPICAERKFPFPHFETGNTVCPA